MSLAATVEALRNRFGQDVISVEVHQGDARAVVPSQSWKAVAEFLRNDLQMDHFIDITAIDYPERVDLPRFDVVLLLRSSKTNHRAIVKTRVDEKLDSLAKIWNGANWGEREVFDMFGVRFEGHPDLRRILMYEEFEGYPLRKDYPIEKTQPLVPYRKADDNSKLAPFGKEEGQPWGRIDWNARLKREDQPVSPTLAQLQNAPEITGNNE